MNASSPVKIVGSPSIPIGMRARPAVSTPLRTSTVGADASAADNAAAVIATAAMMTGAVPSSPASGRPTTMSAGSRSSSMASRKPIVGERRSWKAGVSDVRGSGVVASGVVTDPFDQTHYPFGVTDEVEVLTTAAEVPLYAHPGDAGADLVSADRVHLAPGERTLIGTGVSVALPAGYVAFVVPRSGLASNHGITVVNSPGTVDAGYRGEIRVSLLNTDREAGYTIEPGDRIAQLIVMPVSTARFIQVERLPGSQRGERGFGSTGYSTTEEGTRSG